MRTKKSFYNFLGSLTLQFFNAVVGFFLLKLFITAYGSSINGLISSIKQFLSYLNLVEAGVGAAAIAALYRPLANNNILSINRILSATKLFYLRSGYIFLTLIVVLAMLYPIFLSNEEITPILAAFMVLILGGSGIFEFFFIGKYRVLLTADQRSYVLSMIQLIGTALNAITCIVLIKLDFNVLVVQMVATLIYLSRFFIILNYVKKVYPKIRFDLPPDNGAINRKWDVLVHQISALVVFNTPIIIITIFCGLREVSVYAVYSMVFSSITLVVSSFSSGLLAGFGEILVTNNRKALLKGYNTFEYIYYAVVAWAYTCSAVLIIPFMKLYTQGITDTDYVRVSVAGLFIVIGVAHNVRVPSNTLVDAAAHFKETKYRSILEATINLVVSLALVNSFGIIGVLLGGLCSYAYRTTDFIVYTSRNILKCSFSPTLRKLVRNLVLSLIAISPFIYILEVNVSNFGQWLAWAVVVSMWTFVIIFLGNLLLDPITMKDIIRRIGMVLKSRKNT